MLRHNSATIGGVILLIAAGSLVFSVRRVRRGLHQAAPEALRVLWKTPGG